MPHHMRHQITNGTALVIALRAGFMIGCFHQPAVGKLLRQKAQVQPVNMALPRSRSYAAWRAAAPSIAHLARCIA